MTLISSARILLFALSYQTLVSGAPLDNSDKLSNAGLAEDGGTMKAQAQDPMPRVAHTLSDPAVKPFPSNFPVDPLIATYSPELKIVDGCNPTTAYNAEGEIFWQLPDPLKPLPMTEINNFCKSTVLPQIYARKRLAIIDDKLRLAIVYAWKALVPNTAGPWFVWNSVVVIPASADESKPQTTGGEIWTPVHGGPFPIDQGAYNRRHTALVQQNNPDASKSDTHGPGIAPIFNGQTLFLQDFPIIDVDSDAFPAKARTALDYSLGFVPECPLAHFNIDQVVRTALSDQRPGYPLPPQAETPDQPHH